MPLVALGARLLRWAVLHTMSTSQAVVAHVLLFDFGQSITHTQAVEHRALVRHMAFITSCFHVRRKVQGVGNFFYGPQITGREIMFWRITVDCRKETRRTNNDRFMLQARN